MTHKNVENELGRKKYQLEYPFPPLHLLSQLQFNGKNVMKGSRERKLAKPKRAGHGGIEVWQSQNKKARRRGFESEVRAEGGGGG